MKSRTENSLLNILAGVGSQAIFAFLKIISRTVFIYCLSVEYLGVNGLFNEIITMLSFTELGIGSAIGYALYKPLYDNDKEKVASLMQLFRRAYIINGILVAVLGLSLLPFIDYIVKAPDLLQRQIRPIFLFYIFNTAETYFFSYKSTLLSADQKNYVVKSTRVVFQIIQTIIQAVVLLLTHNFFLYLGVESLITLVNNIVVSKYVDKHYPSIFGNTHISTIDPVEKRIIVRNVRALMLIKINAILVNSTDNTFISILGGIAEVGYYSNYNMIMTTVTGFINQLFAGVNSSVGNLNAEGNREKSHEIFQGIHLANFWLYGWLSIGFITIINPLITVWIGRNYLLADQISYIVAINAYIVGMQNAVWVFKDAYGLFRYGRYMGFCTAVLNILFSYFLGKRTGLFGILLASALCRACTGLWYDAYALYKYGFKRKGLFKYYLQYLGLLILATITGLISYQLSLMITGEPLVELIIRFLIACIIPNIIFFVALHHTDSFKTMREMMIHTMQTILKKRKSKS